MQRGEVLAKPEARGANCGTAASVVDTASVAWEARDVVTWSASATTRPGLVAQLMFESSQTPWCKVLEINVATASSMKVVCTFAVRIIGVQGKKRAAFMFGGGNGLHRCWSYQMYHEDHGRNWWYALRGLQGVGGDEVSESVVKPFAAWVKERKDSYFGG